MEPLLMPLILLAGLVIGWLAGRYQGRRELDAYKQGVNDGERRGGPCWVKTQIPKDS